ncbi:6-phosphogluconolactonase [Corynebacterium epidermidicanis]|uniref:6-phosphogluconolactonase n=1 Tax=Corynebacterium epidermidicanis TaxID=1050174 RepID=A0A0G3GUL2_9CORY|nr:6-phosphogluconolactonase [Corynebacterium epidermidicanis]AKK03208.1 6-phosphogluconolactonase [Corynebacterium epidermidicanis]
MVDVLNFADQDSLVAQAAQDLVTLIAGVQAAGGLHGDGVARVVLTGGGAGIKLLGALAEHHRVAEAQAEDFPVQRIDWSRVHVFFGDERAVAVSHPDSNEGQARAALLDAVKVPETAIHSYELGSLSLTESAQHYAQELESWAPKGFDVHLLGMGGEGHINSIFPHSAAVAEQEKLVVAVTDSPKPPAERVSLTLPAIARAQHVWLLVAGAEKATAASHIIAGSPAEDWPAAGAHGALSTRLYLAVN